MSALRSFRQGRLRTARHIATVSVLVVVGLLFVSAAQAVHDNGMFELDGNTVHNSATTPPYDWNSLFGSTGNRLITPDPINGPILADGFFSDAATPDQTYFTSNKDIQPIASGTQHWGCDPINNPLAKDDLLNAYAALVQVPANAPDNAGHQVLYLGSERGSNNGTSFAGFWLLKDKNVGCSGTNDFSGQHTDGDILIVSNYTNGGGTQDVQVYRWTGNDATGSPVLQSSFNGSICSGSLSNDNACAIANTSTITTPWSPTSHDSNTFVETGIDLTTLLGSEGGCFTNFLAETRSSAEITATLKDFAGGQFSTCVTPPISTTATPGGSSNPIGVANQHDVANISGVTGRPDPTGTITFFLCNPTQVTAGGCESGGTQVGSAVTIVNGSATSANASGSLTGTPGKYCWRAEYTPDSDGAKFYVAGSHTDATDECFTVIKNSPALSTTQNPDSGAIGATYNDTAHLTGGAAPTGTITFTLYSNNNCTGVLDTETTSVSGNGDYSTPNGFVLNHAGTYYWVASYSGDSNNNAAGPTGCTDEPVVVAKNSPALSTTQNPDSGAIGDLYNDTAHLTGGAAPTGTITFTLYSNNNCTGVLDTETTSVSGNGDYSTPTGFHIQHAGTYYWTASYGGDSDNNAAGPTGCTDEPVVVAKNSPEVSTTQNPAAGNVGDTYNDTAHLTGGAAPTGTITFKLYSNDDCTGLLDTETTSVSGNGDYSTPTGFQINSSGVYYWVASYSGDSDNNGFTSGCADEPVAVNAANIHIVKTPDAAQVNAGEDIGFTLTVYNDGNGDAKGVALTDTLPTNAGLDWSIESQGAGWNSTCAISLGVLSCGPVTVPAGTTQGASTFTVHITSPTTAATGGDCPETGVVNNTGNVTTTNDGSDDDSASTCVAAPVIHIVKTPDAAQVNAGEQIGFTLTVSNSGSGDAHGVTLSDTLPTNAGLDWSIESQGAGWNGSCAIAAGVLSCGPVTVPAGTTQAASTFTVHIVSDTTAATGGDCSETGLVDNTGSVTTTNDGSDQDSAEVCVKSPTIHILKTPDAAQVNAGEQIGFTLTVWNSGNGDAHGVTLSDTLPTNAGLNWSIGSQGAGWSGSCAISLGVLSCGPVTVPAGTTQGASTFTVHVVSGTTAATGGDCEQTGLVDNTGHVTTTNDGSDESSAEVCVKAPAIHIAKTADAAKVEVGQQIGFTMTVWNDGNGDAHGVKLNDVLPSNPGLSWSIASQGAGWNGSCAIAAGVLSCGPVTVPAGTTQGASTFTVHIVSGTTGATGGDCPETGVVDNTGSVTTTNDGSDDSSASTCVQALVDLSITKSGSPATQELSGDSLITWTMVVTNNGPSADTGVKITDPMPAGNTFVSASASPHGTCTGGAILTCDLGTMAAGEQITITLVTKPSSAGTQTNTAAVSGDRPETNTGNNQATASVEVTNAPFTPPCIAVNRVTPKQLFVGRKTTLKIHVSQGGKVVKGIRVRIKGPKVNVKTKASNAKGVITHVIKMKKAGVLVFTPIAPAGTARCNTKRVGVTNVFTPPVTG